LTGRLLLGTGGTVAKQQEMHLGLYVELANPQCRVRTRLLCLRMCAKNFAEPQSVLNLMLPELSFVARALQLGYSKAEPQVDAAEKRILSK
jgi:hypothetical protein